LRGFESERNILGRLETLAWVLLEAVLDDSLQRWRNGAPDLREIGRIVMQG
jgi:hypothetical protein